MKKKKKILAMALVIVMTVFAFPAVASPEDRGPMPGEDDMFWQIFAQMSTPDDFPNCVAALENYIAQHPDEFVGPQGVEEERSQMTEMCTQVGLMRTEMQASMAADGAETSLFDPANTNWHAIDGLYFQKSENGVPMGRISFSHSIDFMTYRFFNFMSNFGNMVQFNDGYISLNATMVPDMVDYGATLTMYGLDQFNQQPDIYVTAANGRQMKKAVEGVDLSGVVWNEADKSLSFTPSHFSAFRVVQKGTKLKSMKITSVTKRNIKYNARKSNFKITVKGRNLYKANLTAGCNLGFQHAQAVRSARNGKKMVCTFGMSDFSTLGYYPLSVSIIGQGEVTKVNAVRMR